MNNAECSECERDRRKLAVNVGNQSCVPREDVCRPQAVRRGFTPSCGAPGVTRRALSAVGLSA
jgi:hypothetical protein